MKPCPGARGTNSQLLAAGHDAVHREPVAVEVVARRVEDDEVEARGGPVAHPVALRVHAPEERVVERVEVGALRDRGPLPVERPVRAPDVLLQAARPAGATSCARSPRSGRSRGRPRSPTATRLGGCGTVCVPGRTGSRGRKAVLTRSRKSKFRYHASRSSKMCERCMCVPPWKYERGPRSTSPSVSKLTIRRGPSAFRCVDVKPRKSSEPSGIRSAPGHARGRRHLLRQPLAPVHLAGEALADARHGERAFHPVGDLRRGRPDVLLVVAAEEERDVVLLEQRVVGIAREADRVDQRALAGPAVEREVHVCGVGHVASGSTAGPRRP